MVDLFPFLKEGVSEVRLLMLVEKEMEPSEELKRSMLLGILEWPSTLLVDFFLLLDLDFFSLWGLRLLRFCGGEDDLRVGETLSLLRR